jgi:hypothetical protein
MTRRVVGFTLVFYLCSMAPFDAGAVLAWTLVLRGVVSALRARDAASAAARVADPRPVPVAVPRFAQGAMGRESVGAAPALRMVSNWADRCLRPGGQRGGTPTIARYLVIVARDRPELWRDFRLTYGHADEVEILLDRRESPQRAVSQHDRHRRSPTRRGSEVAGQGFCVIPQA